MMMNKWLTLTASLLLAFGPMTGALAASRGMGHASCPAAPQVANEILKSHDLGNRLDTGETDHRGRPIAINLVSEVAREMGHRATFPAWDSNGQWDGVTYIDKCDVDAYYDAVYNFLVYLGADLPPAQAAVTAIEVKTPPDKVVYTEGESLELAGLVVTLTRSDDTTEDVAFEDFEEAGITTDNADGEPLALTDTVVTITHTRSGLSTTLAITVQPPLFGPDPASQPGVTAFYGTPAAGMMVFLDVGQFDITAYREGEVDVFLVGGGGGASGAGGGGGYTATFLNVNTDEIPGNFDGLIAVTVGAGGAGESRNVPGGAGGYSRLGTDETYQADGGGGGKSADDRLFRPGGDGGSGGAGYRTGNDPGGHGGSDGSDGIAPDDDFSGRYDGSGTGQGTTTREWGDHEHPNLYAGGGGGGTQGMSPGSGGAGGGGDGGGGLTGSGYTIPAGDGIDGLGGAGGGTANNASGSAGSGGSGIVLIRWGGYAEDYLSDLQVDQGDLTPNFDATVTAYHVYAEFGAEDIGVTATLSGPQASLTIDGQPALSGEPVSVTLGDPGTDTDIEIIVTTADGAKEKTYTLTVSSPSGFGLFGSFPESQPGVTEFYGTPEAGMMVLKEAGQYALTTYQEGEVDVFLVGGGGGGSGAGGGGGYTATYLNVQTTTIPGYAGGQIAVAVGDGGVGESRNVPGGAGDPSRLGTDATYQADGGGGGKASADILHRPGGDGGSGGAGYRSGSRPGAAGGSDGSDGREPEDGVAGYDGAGSGQGTTTREWGDPEHPNLYAGGGGGGTGGIPGPGGAGGGGDGNGENGTDGLGGGGGGSSGSAGDGGSGIVLIRWGGYAEDYLIDLQVDLGDLTPAFDATVNSYYYNAEFVDENVAVTATLSGPQASLTIDGKPALSGEPVTVSLGDPGSDTEIEVLVTTADGAKTWTYTLTVSRPSGFGLFGSYPEAQPGVTAFYGTPEAGLMVFKEAGDFMLTAYQEGELDVFLVGGGGGGSGAGGGGGYTETYLNVHTSTIPGYADGQFAVLVGDGGAGESRNVPGGAGGASRLGINATYQANGGGGGKASSDTLFRPGGDGGSGGAGYRTGGRPGADGGSDGSDGREPEDGVAGYDGAGTGQGRTTREWEDPAHPNLYAGGGGGGTGGTPGKGGAGGGGDGNGENGTDGLGGGGGGSSGTAGDGGGGAVLIRWGGYTEDYLSDLQVDHGVLTPAFDAAVSAYEVEVEHATEEITITATLTGPQASLTIDGLAATSGEARTVPLGEEGTDTVIEIAVTTADDGRTKVYTVTVSRAINPSIHLSDLSVDPGALSPTFNAFVTAYDVDVDFDVEAVAVTATLWDPASSLTIDGAEATSGEATTVSLGDPGTETEIDIVVTTEDGSDSETYTLTVTKAHDPDSPTIHFIWVTDVHLNLARESTWDTLEWFVSEVNQKAPDFVLNTGDNVDGKIDRETSLQEIDQYVQRWSQISPDILTDHAMGNRDVASWYETDDEDWITAFDQAGIDSLGGSPYADRPVIAGSKLTTTHLITDPFNVRVFVLNVYGDGYSNSDAKAWVKQVLAGDTDLQAVLFFAHSNTFFSSAAAALAESGLEDVTATYMHGHNHTGDPTLDEESSTANLKRYRMHGLNDSNGRYAEATIWPTGTVEFTPVVAP